MEEAERVRFVTQNYERLQGLRRLPLALCVTVVGLLVYLDKGLVAGALAVVMIYPAVFAEWTVGRFYERRFGRVLSGTPATDYVFWAVLIVLVVQNWLDRPLLFGLAGLIGGVYVLAAFWPPGKRRKITVYWPIIAALVVTLGLLCALGIVAPGPLITILGLSVSTGLLLDHLLLVRTFREVPKEDADAVGWRPRVG